MKIGQIKSRIKNPYLNFFIYFFAKKKKKKNLKKIKLKFGF